MPSPFPGMDPFLESPALWRSFHQLFIAAATTALNAQLPPGFVAAVADPPIVLSVLPEEARENFIHIIALGDAAERIVTVIELLSPANKAAGSGREEYLRKQISVLDSNAHLLEIDLLRAGSPTTAAPVGALRREVGGAWDYLCCLHRAEHRYRYECWPNRLRERLPRVPTPLTPALADVTLPLQALVDQVYDEALFARRINYAATPLLPLTAEDAAWADTLLREKGLR